MPTHLGCAERATISDVVDLGFLGGVMGMRADSEENIVMPGRDRLQRGVAPDACRDREKAPDTRRASPGQDACLVGRKIGKIEMAMAVDEHHGRRRVELGLDIARKDRGRRRQARLQLRAAPPFRHPSDWRRSGLTPRRSRSLAAAPGMKGCVDYADRSQRFRRHIKDGGETIRAGFALHPGFLAREIAVGGGDDAPDIG